MWLPDVYEAFVTRVFHRMRSNPVARALLADLRRDIEIRPWPDHARLNSTCNPVDVRNATVAGHGVPQCFNPVPECLGTGRGTEATIEFTPQIFPRLGPFGHRRVDGWILVTVDEVLLHELVHADQMGWGAEAYSRVAGQYQTLGEFCAVWVTNVYRSYLGRCPRLGHDGGPWSRARGDIMNPFTYDKMTRHEKDLLHELHAIHPSLFNAIGNLAPNSFSRNPFRDYLRRLRGRPTMPVRSSPRG